MDFLEKISLLYRGVDSDVTAGKLVNPYLKNPRRPLHSSIEAHAQADQWFHDKFDISFRSQALFSTGNQDVASCYGNPMIIEPYPGEACQCCWSPRYGDLFGVSNKEMLDHETIVDLLERGNYVVFPWDDSKTRQRAAKSGNEVMLFAAAFMLSNPLTL